jgi:hypothetical protein
MSPHVPQWLRCAVCNKVARPAKNVTRIAYGENAQLVRGGREHARVCANGDCEDRWRAQNGEPPTRLFGLHGREIGGS